MPIEDTMEQKSRHALKRYNGIVDSKENVEIYIPEGSFENLVHHGTETVSNLAIPGADKMHRKNLNQCNRMTEKKWSVSTAQQDSMEIQVTVLMAANSQ